MAINLVNLNSVVLTDTLTDYYLCPANTTTKFTKALFSKGSGSGAITLVYYNAVKNESYFLLEEVSISANSTYPFLSNTVLKPGDKLKAKGLGVNMILSGIESGDGGGGAGTGTGGTGTTLNDFSHIWSLNNTLTDAGASPANLTATGFAYDPSRRGYVNSLDGGRLRATLNVPIAADFTLACKFYTTTSGNFNMLFSNDNNGDLANAIWIGILSGTIRMWLWQNGALTGYNTGLSVSGNVIYDLVIRHNNSSKFFTVNLGTSSATINYTYALINPSATYFTLGNFGTSADGNGTSLLGLLADAKIGPRYLTDTETTELIKRMSSSYPYP